MADANCELDPDEVVENQGDSKTYDKNFNVDNGLALLW